MKNEYCCFGFVLYEIIRLKENLWNNETKTNVVKEINVFFPSFFPSYFPSFSSFIFSPL
jgi:hypothetical protein